MRPILAVAGGLLGSSCCLIQLVLNSLSIGCAGFAILDPYRWLFTTLLLCSLLYSWLKYGITRQFLISVTIAGVLLASPVVVKLRNQPSIRHTTIEMVVDGVACEGCASRVRGKLLEYVDDLSVHFDLEAKQATLHIDTADTSDAHQELLREAVAQMGYTVTRSTVLEPIVQGH